jgi:23S rRNA (adenine2503-C2)-methyltransferase
MSVHDVVSAAAIYREKTGRDVTFEYVLIAGVNDSAQEAGHLVRLLAGRPVTVNVIELNEVAGSACRAPKADVVRGFVGRLRQGGLNVTHRRRRGSRANAACGQLRLHRGLLRGPA